MDVVWMVSFPCSFLRLAGTVLTVGSTILRCGWYCESNVVLSRPSGQRNEIIVKLAGGSQLALGFREADARLG